MDRAREPPIPSLPVKLCLCFSLFFSYPLMLIPLAVMLEQKAAAAASSADNNRCLVIVLPRLSLVAVTVCLILSLPGFADLLEVIGATAVSGVALIMPALCHLGATWRDKVGRYASTISSLEEILGTNVPQLSGKTYIYYNYPFLFKWL